MVFGKQNENNQRIMTVYGFYRLLNYSHGRGYGRVECETLEEGYKILYKSLLQTYPGKVITECYVEHVGYVIPTSKGFNFRTYYGFDTGKNSLFAMNCKLPWAEYINVIN